MLLADPDRPNCYVGSETDPATGEIVDLYFLCGDKVTDSLTPS
jgi:hypothetical protein